MLKKAIEIRKKEGDEALYEWFNSLSDEDKNKCLKELNRAISEVLPHIAEVLGGISPESFTDGEEDKNKL